MEKKPTLLVKIDGCTWDKDGEPVMIETEDQCRGVIQFTIDDESVHARTFGDVDIGDLGSMLYLIRQMFDDASMEAAEKAAAVMEDLGNASEADIGREGMQKLPGQDGGLQDDM